MILLMDSAQELVWRVAKAKCPVSEMFKVASMVSKSLISPTRTTSGSSLKAYFRALPKEVVSA